MEKTKDNYITQSDLINEFGWTKTLANRYLPEPILKTNPKYACAAPMKLWDKSVVLAAMEREDFQNDLAKAEKRRAAGKKAAATRRDALMAEVEKEISKIKVQVVTDEELWDQIVYERELFCIADVEWETLQRWSVNMIRHELTDYDDYLFGMSGKPGCHEAYLKYKFAVLDAIASAYPRYANECERQKKRSVQLDINRMAGLYR
ncbi:MAG: hypothetical protein NC081_06760 [Roseburia sp.]|nr:hypothetical protein [Roseburia sp.]